MRVAGRRMVVRLLIAAVACVVAGVTVIRFVMRDGSGSRGSSSSMMSSSASVAATTTAAPRLSAVTDPAVQRASENAMRHFLDASREGSASRGDLVALTDCGDNGTSYFPSPLLADYVLLPFEMRGDTVIARASITTVAEQDVDRRGNGFVARQRVQTDVLEWDVIPLDDNRWVVCNGLRFGYVGADSLTRWRPDGSSYRTAMALVDSVRRARAR